MTETTTSSKSPLQFYVLDDDGIIHRMALRGLAPADAELHVFKNSEDMLKHVKDNPVTDAPYELLSDTILDSKSFSSSYGYKHGKPFINAALHFAEFVAHKGAELKSVHVWSGWDKSAQDGAQELHAALVTLHVTARAKGDDQALWDSNSGPNPAIARLREEERQRKQQALEAQRATAIYSLNDEIKSLPIIPHANQPEEIKKAADMLATLQVDVPAGIPSLRFEEGCGEPKTGHIAYSLTEAKEQHNAGKPSILVANPFNEDMLSSLEDNGVVGLICLNEEIKGHLSIRLNGRGISAVVNPHEGDITAIAKPGDAITLDPDNLRIAIGAHPVVAMTDALKHPNLTIRYDGDLRWAANNFLLWAEQTPTADPAPAKLPERAINVSGDSDLGIARMFNLPVGLLRSEHIWLASENNRTAMRDYLLECGDKEELTSSFNKLCRAATGSVLVRSNDIPWLNFRLLDVSPQELFDEQGIAAFKARYGEDMPRGVQLAKQKPDIYAQQIGGIVSTYDMLMRNPQRRFGNHEWLTLLVPNVKNKGDMQFVTNLFNAVERPHYPHRIRLGAMIETVDACYNIGEIAPLVSSISIGTNDLTAEVLGISRYDKASVAAYMQRTQTSSNPFVELHDKVAKDVRHAMREAVAANPDIEISICGAHAADMASLGHFREHKGLPAFASLSVAPTFKNLLVTPMRQYRQNVLDFGVR